MTKFRDLSLRSGRKHHPGREPGVMQDQILRAVVDGESAYDQSCCDIAHNSIAVAHYMGFLVSGDVFPGLYAVAHYAGSILSTFPRSRIGPVIRSKGRSRDAGVICQIWMLWVAVKGVTHGFRVGEA